MNFDESILPLDQLLISRGFLLSKKSDFSIEYYSKSAIIRLSYDRHIQLFTIYIGKTEKLLTELTPEAIEVVFKEDSFKDQSTLTINNLISFLKNKGEPILAGNIGKLEKLNDYSKKKSFEYHEQLMHSQNLKEVDNAWNQKDYHSFVKAFKNINQNLLPESYFKKHEIALSKIKGGQK